MEQLTLQVTEIYKSIQGESSFAGYPCVFIRLTGCPLRCRWCDTAYSFEGGEKQTLEQILERVQHLDTPLVELTGGEPLAQKNTAELVQRLVAAGYKVLMETGGSEPIGDLHAQLHIIMDIKCPGSGMSDRNLWANLDILKASDEIKFVVADFKDFQWAQELCVQQNLHRRFHVLFSPAFGLVPPKDLAAWILSAGLPGIRMQIQQHKYIWHPRAKGV